jgi:Putative transposase.
LLTALKNNIEKSYENDMFIDHLFKLYPNGFYVRAKDTINNKKNLIAYIGRYIRHPSIAECRIINYNDEESQILL